MDLEFALSDQQREKLRRFKQGIGGVIIILSLLGLWTGTDFLKEVVFKHYFNPSRHIIIEQDPVTGEVYAWKDVLGNVYTQEDLHVKLFPYGMTVLILAVGGIAIGAYQILYQHYLMILLLQNRFVPLGNRR